MLLKGLHILEDGALEGGVVLVDADVEGGLGIGDIDLLPIVGGDLGDLDAGLLTVLHHIVVLGHDAGELVAEVGVLIGALEGVLQVGGKLSAVDGVGVEAVGEGGDGVDVGDSDVAALSALLQGQAGADAAGVGEGGDGVQPGGGVQHEAGDPVARHGGGGLLTDGVLGDIAGDGGQDLGHAVLHGVPGGLTDGGDAGIQGLVRAVIVVEGLHGFAVVNGLNGIVHNGDFLGLGVDLDLGSGEVAGLVPALDVGHAVLGNAGQVLVGVAAGHQVHHLGVHGLCDVGGVGVGQDHQNVSLGLLADLGGLGGKLLQVLVDGVGGDLGGHDVGGVVVRVADDGDLVAALLQDHVVLGEVHPLTGPGVVEVAHEHGDVAVALVLADLVGGHGALLVSGVLGDVPVELVVAQGHGVIAHGVIGGTQGGAIGQVGVGNALVDVAAVQKQNAGIVLIGPGVGHDFGQIGQAVLEGLLLVAGHIGDMSMHVRGLEDLDGVPAVIVVGGGLRALSGSRVLRGKGRGDQRQDHNHGQDQGNCFSDTLHVFPFLRFSCSGARPGRDSPLGTAKSPQKTVPTL